MASAALQNEVVNDDGAPAYTVFRKLSHAPAWIVSLGDNRTSRIAISKITMSLHVTCFKVGDRVAGGVRQIEMVSGNLPPAHLLQRLQEYLSVSMPSGQAIIVPAIWPRVSWSPFSS